MSNCSDSIGTGLASVSRRVIVSFAHDVLVDYTFNVVVYLSSGFRDA